MSPGDSTQSQGLSLGRVDIHSAPMYSAAMYHRKRESAPILGKVSSDAAGATGRRCSGLGSRITGLAVIVVLSILAGCGSPNQPVGEVVEETIVLADPNDRYYELARLIAEEEHSPIVSDLDSLLQFNPRFVLLVASPVNLDQVRLLEIGGFFRAHDRYPAVGIITGSTEREAKLLWERGGLLAEGDWYLAGDTTKGQLVFEPSVTRLGRDPEETNPLSRESLLDVLGHAGFLYWARHASPRSWFWDTESHGSASVSVVRAGDLREIAPLAIYTPSCSSLQPSVAGSIALAFADAGAAAYIGHLFSPVTNAFLMRRGNSVPGLYSWREVPLGVVAQIQNRMSGRASFRTPALFMLGDPRTYLQPARPYEILSDTILENGNRVIHGRSDVDGVLALGIPGAAGRRFVSSRGAGSASDDDFFYNNRLQTLDLGPDKYVLFMHAGGEFELELRPRPPLGWRFGDAIIDALDQSWAAIGPAYEWPLSVAFIAVPGVIFLIRWLRRRAAIRHYATGFIAGAAFAALRVAYLFARLDRYSVNATVPHISVVNILMGFTAMTMTVGVGLSLILDARRVIGRVTGYVFAVLPQLAVCGLYAFNITATNSLYATRASVPGGIWKYHAVWLLLVALLVEMVAVVCISLVVRRRAAMRPAWSVAGSKQ
jgi:hypothetical protein